MATEAIFEELRAELLKLPRPAQKGQREIHWVSHGRMGIAKDYRGVIELYFCGDPIIPRRPTVRRHTDYGQWESSDHTIYNASKISFSPEERFISMAALIGTESVLAGACHSEIKLEEVFYKVESLIELAIRKISPSENTLLGMLGELILLEQLLIYATNALHLRSDILDMWKGYTPSSRDFIIGNGAIEVKTTRQNSSTHIINSLDQIEPRDIHGNSIESPLYLLSIGLSPVIGGPISLPDQVERIICLLASEHSKAKSPLQIKFLDAISRYGAVDGWGYDHESSKHDAKFSSTYSLTFMPRLYDMQDAEVKIIRRSDLKETFVNSDHIEYQVDLPDTINSNNPLPKWVQAITDMLDTTFGPV